MDVDKSAMKGASVGSPMEVLKVVVRALKLVFGETRMLFEHRNSANFHVLCPDIIVDSRTAVRVREKQLAVLTSDHPEVDWNDIVDERVLTSNGLRLLGSQKYKEISGPKGRTKRYDVAGGRYAPCQIDLESGGKPIHTYRTPAAQSGAEQADLVKLPCEDYCVMYMCN
ncbi:g8934 [Coccomyxa viridis]|uniref:G8934 protein n=1 Tax=Coccomyxa viridis TaxID=1274662 RepID=A0ABP1G2V0_9CHLO